jgi:hypothetical protein
MQIDNVAVDGPCIFVISMGTITPAATAANLGLEQDFDVPAGTPALKVTDAVLMSGVASGNSLVQCKARVKDSNTISIQYDNSTAGSLTYAAGAAYAVIIRPV